MSDQQLIELDGRRRASLNRIARHSRYLVEIADDGVIVMTPAVVMAEADAALLRHPDILDTIDQAAHDEIFGERRERPRRKE